MISFFEWCFGKKEKDLNSMTKKELELKGREHGIELDRRYKKAALIKKLKRKMQEV